MPHYNEFAPAKINLALHVIARNESGYHQLESLVVFAKIGDRLQISTNETDKLEINGEFSSSLKSEKTNLILEALYSFKKNWPNTIQNTLKIKLEKNLPIASGIGGGSADCAATLRALNNISGNKISNDKLQKLSLELGADVPMCLSSKPAIISNIGEIIKPIKSFPNLFIVLVNPLTTISTAQIFNHLEKTNNEPLPEINTAFDNINNLKIWLAKTRNDLAKPAFTTAPIIKQIIDEFKKNQNCLFTNMSGSGATVFALFANFDNAKKASVMIGDKWPNFWVKHAPLMSNNA